MRKRLLLLILLSAVACLCAACGGGSTVNAPSDAPGADGFGIDDLARPEGVDAGLWAEMQAFLQSELERADAARVAAAAPQDEGSRVPDFRFTLTDNNEALFEWSYRNTGDYDQNGEVNISDLQPIALHFGANQFSPAWSTAQVVDGDGNGEINLSDITPIATNYRSTVERYLIESSINAEGGPWNVAAVVPFGDGVVPAGGGFREYAYLLPLEQAENGAQYRTAPHSGGPAPQIGTEDSETPEYGVGSTEVLLEFATVPQNVTATQGSVTGAVDVSWSALSGAQFYHVYRADAEDGPYAPLGDTGTGVTEYSDTSVSEAVHYWYKVSAETADGETELSEAAEGWSNTTPDPPENVQASDGTSGTGIIVSWDKSAGANGYNVYRDAADFQIAQLGEVEIFEDSGIVDTDEHSYWVSAVSYGLESAPAGPDTGYRGTAPEILSVLLGEVFENSPITISAIVTGDMPLSYSWTFGGGATPNTSSEEAPDIIVNSSGSYSGSLTCTNLAGEDTVPFTLEVLPYRTELLIVYNSSITDDLNLVEYYSSPVTGRAIDSEFRLGLPLGEYVPSISREDYESEIREPIKVFLDNNPIIKNSIKYILLMKGLPHQIPGVNEFDSDSTYSSVDSELCTLYQDDLYPTEVWLWNDTTFMEYPGNGFHLSGDVDFQPGVFQTTDATGTLRVINYLVGRLSAYTYAEAKLMVDRSLEADTSRTGWVIFDSRPSRLAQDTMVRPVYVYPAADPDLISGKELLVEAGFNVFAEITDSRVTADFAELPIGAGENVIGYCSWGVHSGFEGDYILEDLGFSYRPGACFMSYESFNGTAFSDPINRRGNQGQICDFIRRGGTVAIGNAYEPFTLGVGDERWVFDRYLNHGDRWIEAAYKGLRLLSWQEVVIGDPLCRVVAD